MKRNELVNLFQLKPGDRFCFKSDKKKQIVCTVVDKKQGCERKAFNAHNEVIFLRNAAVPYSD